MSFPAKKQLQIFGDIPACEVDARAGVIETEAIEDGDTMADAVSAVEDHPGGFAGGPQTEHSLNGREVRRHLVALEKVLGHFEFLAVGCQRRLRYKHRLVLR